MHVALNSMHVPQTVAINCYAHLDRHVDCSQPNCDDSLIEFENDKLHSTSQKLKQTIKNSQCLPSAKLPSATTDEIGSTLSTRKKVQVRLIRLAFAASSASAIAAGVERLGP